jgi:mono/diheme cytochrome c family protein
MQLVMLSKAGGTPATPNLTVILSEAKDPCTPSNLLCAKRILMRTAMFLTLLTTCVLAQNSSYEPDPNWHAPSKAAMRRNPLTASPEITGGGKKLFEVHCAECHQASGSGMADKHSADLRQPIVQSQSDGALFWKITNGNPGRGMPSFSRLPEKQRWQLVLFLRTLRAQAGQSATK